MQDPGSIELLLTDIVMPGVPGIQVAKYLLGVRPQLKEGAVYVHTWRVSPAGGRQLHSEAVHGASIAVPCARPARLRSSSRLGGRLTATRVRVPTGDIGGLCRMSLSLARTNLLLN